MSSSTQKISLHHLAHVYYTHKNLDKAHQFLLDFGFSAIEERSTKDKIYYRGYGNEPFLYCAIKGDEDVFGGAAWAVDSIKDLELATKLPGATPIHDSDAPGGGKRVTFTDPGGQFPLHLVFGQTPVQTSSQIPEELQYNFPTSKHRAVNKTQRFKPGPAPIYKLGHFGVCVTDFDKSLDFYTSHFNLKPTDFVYDGETNKDHTVFMHLDRGEELVDHHVFFFYQGPKYHVHHSSFEVFDFDVQMLGHTWLTEKGYENCWGVGRHVMGSQIFDYWFDPSRFVLEHYIDGDLVNDKTPTSRTKAGPGNLHVWGPEVPATFLV